MAAADPSSQPSLPWRVGSSIVMGVTGAISRLVLFGANTTEVHGLGNFLELLDQRRNVENRKRGLITGRLVSLRTSEIGEIVSNSLRPQCPIISVCTYVSHVHASNIDIFHQADGNGLSESMIHSYGARSPFDITSTRANTGWPSVSMIFFSRTSLFFSFFFFFFFFGNAM